MSSRYLIVTCAWALSLGGAYLIGSGTSKPASPAPGTRAVAPGKGDRSAPRPSGSAGASRERLAGSSSPGLRIVGAQPPRQAVATLAGLTDPVARTQGFLALVENLAPEEFEAVVDDFRSLGITSERFTEYGILLHAWGKADPVAALDYALENTGTNFARQTILASWAGYDPNAAAAFARDNFDGEGANPLMVGVIRGVVQDDLNLATSLMEDMPRSRERGEALETILPILLAKGADEALIWSAGISDEALRGASQADIARNLAEKDPAQGLAVLMNVSDQDAQFRAFDDVIESWAKQDVSAAMAYAETVEPRLRGEAVEGVIRELASEKPVEASDWMASMRGEGVNIDPAIERFMWSAGSREPDLAAEWIGQMSDKREAERNYHRFLGRWVSRDGDAAKAWMTEWQDELPNSIQRRFLQRPDAER